MKILLLLLFAAAPEYRQALPGYRYQFPRDHFEHPDFRTEWWYYTGNVHARDGHRYGFELVFFRQGEHQGDATNPSAWRIDDLYLAHLALTDIDGQRFRYYKRLNRSGPGIAGARAAESRVWNGNWEAQWNAATGAQTLTAVAEDVRFTLRSHAAHRAGDSRRERRQPEGAGRGQGIALCFLPAAGRFGDAEWGRGGGIGVDGPRVVHAPTGSQSAGVGLVQRATGFRRGVDALSTAPRGRDERPILVGHVHRSRRAGEASEARRFPAAAAGLLDQSEDRRRATPYAGASRFPHWVSLSNARLP